jgi:N-acetylmuramoyl-L-alanine amidase
VKGSRLVSKVQVSPNVEARVNGLTPGLIILHYTGMASAQAAVDWLCNPTSKVSCHYLVDENGDIVQMVDEDLRAWHAGVSSWRGQTDINSLSIGIEIQNQGHAAGCPAFPGPQMQAVAALCTDIMERYGLGFDQVLAHSDVAPGRKVDPGEAFDWEWLNARGIGVAILAAAVEGPALQSGEEGDAVLALQKNLSAVGYGLDQNGRFDERTRIVIEAFQRRFRRRLINGVADMETREILQRVLAALPDSQLLTGAVKHSALNS